MYHNHNSELVRAALVAVTNITCLRDRDLLRLIFLNFFFKHSSDTADLILSSDWSVSLKLCSDWLGELLTDDFQLL